MGISRLTSKQGPSSPDASSNPQSLSAPPRLAIHIPSGTGPGRRRMRRGSFFPMAPILLANTVPMEKFHEKRKGMRIPSTNKRIQATRQKERYPGSSTRRRVTPHRREVSSQKRPPPGEDLDRSESAIRRPRSRMFQSVTDRTQDMLRPKQDQTPAGGGVQP